MIALPMFLRVVPWRTVAMAGAALVLVFAAWRALDAYGDRREAAGREAVQADWDAERVRVAAEIFRRNEVAAASAARLERKQDDIRREAVVITKEVERVVQKPVYRDECLDADGLRVLADAIGTPGDPEQSQDAVPRSDSPD